jgi:N-acetylmuramoyl-L-alanine amidase
MKRILLGAGHEGRTSGATGAPNEMSFNIDISNKVADELRLRGFEVRRINADPKPEEIAGDWDLALFVHYDSDSYQTGGGFVDFPEPSTDGATVESQRIAYLLRQEYFGTTHIINHPERSNEKTRYYYMWNQLSSKTPCVLIECGVGMHIPDDWDILHHNRPLVVEGLVKGICLAFNVPYLTPEPPTTPSLPQEPPQMPPSEPTLPPVSSGDIVLIDKIKKVVWGKGWVWVRMNQLKELLPK